MQKALITWVKYIKTDIGFIAVLALLFLIYQNLSPSLRLQKKTRFTKSDSFPIRGYTSEGKYFEIFQIAFQVENNSIKAGRISTAEIYPKGNSTLYYTYKVLHTDKVRIPPFATTRVNALIYSETTKVFELENDTNTIVLFKLLDEENKYVKEENGEEAGSIGYKSSFYIKRH